MNTPDLQPNTFWHVVYECRETIVEICYVPNPQKPEFGNIGFFAFGQDVIWHPSAVAEWIKEIKL